MAESRIWTLDRACPQPRDYRELLADIRLQVRPTLSHLARDLDLRIEVSDAFLGLISHPLAISANIFGQARRALLYEEARFE